MLETLVNPNSTQGGENLSVETISRKEAIAWLAGVLDGEGCIAAYWQMTGKDMAGPGFRVMVKFSGAHPALIEKTTQVLKDIGVGFSVMVHKRKNPGEKATAEVVVAGKGRIRKLLNILCRHLTEKKRQAELMLELIAYRESLAQTGQQKGFLGSKPLGLYEDQKIQYLIVAIKEAKREPMDLFQFSRRPGEEFGSRSSETLRRRLRMGEVMIKSELHGDMQTAAEMTVG